jgi:EmrB/QacA subfamily drug resistance transporter
LNDEQKWYRLRWVALIFLAFSLLVIALDNTVLNLALPSIARDLGASSSELQWIVDAYILVFAGLLLTMGTISDRLGRKRVLQAGLVVFGLFSLGAALSQNTGTLIAMRALMGIGGASIMPATLSILTATFRDPKERAQAIAVWAATFALGTGIGPLVGGYLLEHYHWSSVFYINIPIVVVGLIGGYYTIQNSRGAHPRKIDFMGFFLSITGLFALVYAIIQAGTNGWTGNQVIWSFAAAFVLLGLFALGERRSKSPILPLHFFRNPSFSGANLALTLVAFGLFGSFFFLSQYLQSIKGYTPLEAGVRLLPMALTSFVSASASARIAHLLGTKFTVGTGILASGAGFFYFSRVMAVDTSYLTIVVGMCIVALGIGMTMSPATNSIMGSIPHTKAGVGSAMNDTTRQVGGALGVAVLGTILNSVYLGQINQIQWPVGLPAQVLGAVQSSVQGAILAAQNIASQNPALAQTIVANAKEAFTTGAIQASVVATIVLAVAALATYLILPSKVRAPEGDDNEIAGDMKDNGE